MWLGFYCDLKFPVLTLSSKNVTVVFLMSVRKNYNKLIFLLPIIAGCCWGSSGTFVRILTERGMDNITILFSRTVPSFAIIFICLLLKDRDQLKVKMKDIWLFILIALTGTLGLNICYNAAMVSLSLSFAAVLLSLTPVYVLVIAAIVFHEKITKNKVLCAIFAVGGCVLVSGIIGSDISWSIVGIIAGVGAGFFNAINTVTLKETTNRNYTGLTVTMYCMLMGSIALIPFVSWDSFATYIEPDPLNRSLFLLVPTFLNTLVPYICYNLSLKYMESGTASILASGAEPSAATVFGIILYSEIPTIWSLSGLFMTIIALTMLVITSRNKLK